MSVNWLGFTGQWFYKQMIQLMTSCAKNNYRVETSIYKSE